MKNHSLSIAVLVCLLLAALSIQAQNPEKPYIFEVSVGGVVVDHQKAIDLADGSQIGISFAASPNQEGLTYSVKEVVIYSMRSRGAAQKVGSFKMTNDGKGLSTATFSGPSKSSPSKTQYILEGVVMHKNGKKKAANIPIRDRSFIVN